MSNKNIDWCVPLAKFLDHFNYSCNIPHEAEIFSERDFNAFNDLIDKCIADNFDYTIEAYGTVPPKNFDFPKILID